MIYKKYSALVTDLDGVLFDSVKVYKNAIIHTALTLGKQISDEEVQKHIISRATFEGFFGEQKEQASQLFLEYCKEEETGEKFEIFPGVIEALMKIQEEGIQIFGFTDRTKKATQIILDHHGLTDIFEGNYVTSCCTGVRKPSPTGLSTIQFRNNIDPKSMLYIGDTYNDHSAAILSYIDFVGVNSGVNSQKDWEDRKVKNIDYFPKILKILGVNDNSKETKIIDNSL